MFIDSLNEFSVINQIANNLLFHGIINNMHLCHITEINVENHSWYLHHKMHTRKKTETAQSYLYFQIQTIRGSICCGPILNHIIFQHIVIKSGRLVKCRVCQIEIHSAKVQTRAWLNRIPRNRDTTSCYPGYCIWFSVQLYDDITHMM